MKEASFKIKRKMRRNEICVESQTNSKEQRILRGSELREESKSKRMSPLNPDNERISKKKCGKFRKWNLK